MGTNSAGSITVNRGDMECGERSSLPLQNPVRTNNIVYTNSTEKSICISTMVAYRALKYVIIICAAGGLIFKKNFAVKGLKRYLSATQVYSCIVLVFHIETLRWLTTFDGRDTFGTFLFLKIAYAIWSIECVGHYVASFIACECYHRLPELFTEWEKIRGDFSQSMNYISRFTIVCAVILGILVFANTAFATYLIFWTTFQDVLLAPWNREFKYVIVIQTINVIHCMYLLFAWFGPSVLMFMICKILAYEFKHINNRIRELSRMEPSRCAESLEGLRRHHQNLCNLVANADDIFSMQIAISFTGSLVIACLLIYIIIYGDDPTPSGTMIVVIKGFWVCEALAKVILDCVSGAILNDGVSYWLF